MPKKKTKQTKAPKKVAKETPVEAPKKKKKKHTGLKVFAILMTIFVVFPIAFVFIAFFDTSTKKVSVKEVDYQNLVSETFFYAVSNLADNGSLDFTISEDMFDGIMVAACDKLNQKQFIPKMYCYINKSHYNFVVDLQASFFKTRVQLQTTLKQDDENILVFKINQIVLGRLPIPVNWITGILTNFIKDDMLNNAFAQSGFRIKSNLAKAQLTYARADFREDVAIYVERLGANNEYLKLVLDVVGNNKELLSTNYDDGITASIDLTKLIIPDAIPQYPLKFTETELENHKEKIVEWLNEGILEEKRVADVFSYLIRGFKLSSMTVKEFITSIKEGPLGAAIEEYVETDVGSYTGSIVDRDKTRFEAYCGDGKISLVPDIDTDDPTNLKLTVTLDGNSLNRYLAYKMTDAIGKTIPITFKDTDNNWYFEYIFVDNLFVKFDEVSNAPQMTLYLSLNISGYPICLELVTNNIKVEDATITEPISFGNIAFDIKNINFGIIPLESTELLDTLLAMIPESETFAYHPKEGEHELGYFTIALDSYFENIPTIQDFKNDIISLLLDSSKYLTSVDEENNFIITAPKPQP